MPGQEAEQAEREGEVRGRAWSGLGERAGGRGAQSGREEPKSAQVGRPGFSSGEATESLKTILWWRLHRARGRSGRTPETFRGAWLLQRGLEGAAGKDERKIDFPWESDREGQERGAAGQGGF